MDRLAALTRSFLALVLAAALVLIAGALPVAANPSGTGLVISQVYGGGGNTGAQYTNDFVELFNPTSATISLGGMSVQYASATGTGNFSANAVTALAGSLAPGQHYLVSQASGGTNGAALPTPDATGTVNMSGSAGKVILASTTTGLGCNGGSTPCSDAQRAQIVDLVGYGTANFFEGSSAAPGLANTTAALRGANGCTDTDQNGADFVTPAPAPAPRNTSSTATPCTTPTNPSGTGAAAPASVDPGGSTTLTVAVTPGANPTSTGLAVTADLSAIGGPAAQAFFDDGTHGDAHAGDGTFTFATTVTLATAPGAKTLPAAITDAQARPGSASIPLTVTGPSTSSVVVSQVYGGGGNSGTTYTNDFVELFNRSAGPVSLAGASVQYAAAAGATWQVTALPALSLAPGQHFLVQEGAGGGGTTPLPAPDAIGSIAMSATAGKIALVASTTALAGSCPTGLLDLVGYGTTASCFEGSGPAPGPTNTTADLRLQGGCVDTDVNSADFATGPPTPRNAVSPFQLCNGPTGAGAASPSSIPVGGSTTLTVAVTPGSGPTSTGLAVACDLSSIGGAAAQGLFDDGTHGDASGGDLTFSFATTVAAAPGAVTLPCTVSDAEGRSAAAPIALTVEGTFLAIHDIQGAAHISPHAGEVHSTNGIVTARSNSGFWIQDPSPDASVATSEGVFVFTSTAPAVAVGDAVHVNARVQEFRPGSATNANLTTTELASPTVTVVSTGNPLPAAIVVGAGGRVPPNQVIDDDATGSVETSGTFDPTTDGIDFWESLEGMRIQLNDAVAVGPTETGFGETPVVGDDGAGALVRTPRGGVLARPGAFNPERVVVDDLLLPTPTMNVGDHYAGALVGVLDYNFGNFFLEATSLPPVVHDGVTPETTPAPAANQLAVATFNVENLAPSDPQSKYDRLAGLIVDNLKAPDVISVEEVQDSSGATDNGVVAADQTLTKLVAAISAAGGPAYEWREIDPVDDQDGGQPGGNIRQVFLFRTDRGLSFVDRPGGDSTHGTAVAGTGASTQLTFSPGRIDPTSSAWSTSRKPLAGEFLFRGHHLFVIANHFNSKGGDDPLMGRFQPPTAVTEAQRHQQAQIVHDFVASILAADPSADVVVDGDLNDYEFSDTVSILKAGVLHDLIDTLPVPERYSYDFEGNSQTLDHILVGDGLFARPFSFDVVHVNSEFADQASDHDPSVVRITLDDPPTVSAGGPYSVAEGGSVTVSATGADPEGGAVTFAWDLDDNGSFETPGQSVSFSAASIHGPATRTIRVQATDPGGNTSVATATVTISPSARSVIENVKAEVDALAAGATKPDADKLRKASDALGKALDPKLWVGRDHLDPKDGNKVFDRLKDAAQPLGDLLKDKTSTIPDATLQVLIDDLVGAARTLAQTAIDDAAAAGKPTDKARDELAKGDADAAKGNVPPALDHYRNAWQKALGPPPPLGPPGPPPKP